MIEVGAGTGNFLSLFTGIAGRLVATDLTPGMLRVAQERNPTMLLASGDGARLPFADGSFALVTSAHAMHHIPRPVPVLREMRRIARDDGRLLVVDHRVVDRRGRVSNWMWPGEFPGDRIAAVHDYVRRHWNELGMDLQPEGDDFTYLDRRMMFLAVPA